MSESNKVAVSALVAGQLFYWWSGSSPNYFIEIENGFSVPFVVYRNNNSIQKKRLRNLHSMVFVSPNSTHLHLI